MNLHHLRVSTQLSLGFGLLVLLIALMGGGALWGAASVEASYRTVVDDRYPKIVELHTVKENIESVGMAMRNLLLREDTQADLAEIERVQRQNGELLDKLATQIRSSEGQALLATMQSARAAYLPAQARLAELSTADRKAEAVALLNGSVQALQHDYLIAVQALIDHQERLMGAASAEVYGALGHLRVWMGVAAGVGLLLALGMAMAIVRSITAPLARAVAMARAVADGDLAHTVVVESHNETGQLLQALQDMQRSLARVVQGVRHNAESVATASSEIAQGNQDLSHRTEEQASALQQTAASMEQLGSTVTQNADNARQANQLAMGASTVAVQGGAVVGQVVETMREIQQSSQKIADIIAVIDSIAFQTNILALNAAVEAARAGEQGRGFAVVASEVRNLAGRSAEAAKEIKTLINASVSRVEQGTALVDRAGTTMQEVVAAIRRVTDIVGEISAASTEQSAGVSQVGEAVGQMDQTTQQNAALVEESAAAAESLRQQADQLLRAVSVFRLDGMATDAGLPAPRRLSTASAPVAMPPKAAPRLQAPASLKALPAANRQPAAAATAPSDATWTSF